jgi:MFS family permease
VQALYAALAVFWAYTMLFGFRKSFTVCTFDGLVFMGIGYKSCLVIAQVFGYMLAKFYGIRFIAALERKGRYKIILTLTGIGWLSWLFFAVVPAPYNIIFLFTNGFPLGMLWGVVFSYIEGRRATDFIGAALAVSFIFGSGFVKSVGGWLILHFHMSDFWVPFFTGLIFALPLLLFVWMMERIPPPTTADIKDRTERLPMTKQERHNFVQQFLPGLVACILVYCFVTIFRDIRDNFSADMWKELGYLNQPALFSKTETPITIVILALIGSMVMIKNSFKAFMVAHVVMIVGFVVAGTSTWLFAQQQLPPIWWMTLVGLGLYMVYIPYNAVFFERLIAAFKVTGNVGFLIYLADSFGYIGSVGVLLSKEVFKVQLNWVQFFSTSVLWLSVIGMGITIFSMLYFNQKKRNMLALKKYS